MRTFVALLAALAVAGCATAGDRAMDPTGDVTLEVQNLFPIDATVVILVDRQPYRVGPVGGRTGSRFRLPLDVVAWHDLRLVLHPVVGRGREVTSEVFRVSRSGLRVDWEVWPGESRLAVR